MDKYGRQKPLDGRGNQRNERISRRNSRKHNFNSNLPNLTNRTECPGGQEINQDGLCEEKCCIVDGNVYLFELDTHSPPPLFLQHFEVRFTEAFCSDSHHIGNAWWGCYLGTYDSSVWCDVVQTSFGPGEPNFSYSMANTANFPWNPSNAPYWGPNTTTSKRSCHTLVNDHPTPAEPKSDNPFGG